MSVWQCRATMNILSSPNNSKTSILDFPPPNAKCDKKIQNFDCFASYATIDFQSNFHCKALFYFPAPGTVMFLSVEEALLAIMIMPIMIMTNPD